MRTLVAVPPPRLTTSKVIVADSQLSMKLSPSPVWIVSTREEASTWGCPIDTGITVVQAKAGPKQLSAGPIGITT